MPFTRTATRQGQPRTFLLSLCCSLLLVATANAASYTWVGTEGSFGDPLNWLDLDGQDDPQTPEDERHGVPGPADAAVIQSDATILAVGQSVAHLALGGPAVITITGTVNCDLFTALGAEASVSVGSVTVGIFAYYSQLNLSATTVTADVALSECSGTALLYGLQGSLQATGAIEILVSGGSQLTTASVAGPGAVLDLRMTGQADRITASHCGVVVGASANWTVHEALSLTDCSLAMEGTSVLSIGEQSITPGATSQMVLTPGGQIRIEDATLTLGRLHIKSSFSLNDYVQFRGTTHLVGDLENYGILRVVDGAHVIGTGQEFRQGPTATLLVFDMPRTPDPEGYLRFKKGQLDGGCSVLFKVGPDQPPLSPGSRFRLLVGDYLTGTFQRQAPTLHDNQVLPFLIHLFDRMVTPIVNKHVLDVGIIGAPVIEGTPLGASTAPAKLMFLVHGVNSSPSAWANSMKAALEQALATEPAWKVATIDWQTFAADGDFCQTYARYRKVQVAFDLGRAIAELYSYWIPEERPIIQVMGHSAGSWFVDGFADQVKKNLFHQIRQTYVHATLFDSYAPSYVPLGASSTEISELGDKADFAEQYYNNSSVGDWVAHGTATEFCPAVNFKLIPVVRCWSWSDYTSVCSSETADVCHSQPMAWYQATVEGVTSDPPAQGYGFDISAPRIGVDHSMGLLRGRVVEVQSVPGGPIHRVIGCGPHPPSPLPMGPRVAIISGAGSVGTTWSRIDAATSGSLHLTIDLSDLSGAEGFRYRMGSRGAPSTMALGWAGRLDTLWMHPAAGDSIEGTREFFVPLQSQPPGSTALIDLVLTSLGPGQTVIAIDSILVDVEPTLAVEPPPSRPVDDVLGVTPNPNNGTGTVWLALPKAGRARLSLFDVAGRRRAVLVDRHLAAGPHSLPWGGLGASDLAPGIYLLRLEADGDVHEHRLVITR